MPVEAKASRMELPRPAFDEVNDASFDSFPASDPPVWSSMHAGAPKATELALAAGRIATAQSDVIIAFPPL